MTDSVTVLVNCLTKWTKSCCDDTEDTRDAKGVQLIGAVSPVSFFYFYFWVHITSNTAHKERLYYCFYIALFLIRVKYDRTVLCTGVKFFDLAFVRYLK